MTKAIEYKIHGIKCDKEGCGYKDMSVKFEDYNEWLNKPCPECNSNLLTEEDMKTCLLLIGITNSINDYAGDMPDDAKKAWFKIEMNGSGLPEFKFKEIK